jgi:predicted NUDIX family NTP pyrophosphohydrolase
MPVRSAGIVLHRRRGSAREVLLVHPGGPYWARKDLAAWSIPKGLVEPGEDVATAARREFAEETGLAPPAGTLVPLGDFRQPGGKIVTAFALAGEIDAAAVRSNDFTMEWPPKSGRMAAFPEVDRASWFTFQEAEEKIVHGQRPILAALAAQLDGR